MTVASRLTAYLDYVENLEQDPAMDTAEVADSLREFQLNAEEWSQLIDRYGRWKSVTLLCAIGMCIAPGLSQGTLKIPLADLMKFARLAPLENSTALLLCLELLKRGVRQGGSLTLLSPVDRAEVCRLILAGVEYSGEQAWAVAAASTEFLTAIEDTGKMPISELLPPQQAPAVRAWLESFLKHEIQGSYFDMARRLLLRLEESI